MTKMTAIKRTYFASAAASALAFALAPVALAQDAGDDEIVVTGIRQSIAESLELKKESTSIIEAITAEDIGKLPDVSIADSLARLPGVTAQRVRGRAQQISIRGLGPDFSIALLNGREVVSAGNNRGIEFDQFPSELISQGVVYKSPDARLATTGIAGAVDLRTIKPLNYSEPQVNVSAKYVINDNGKLNPDFADDGYRLFGSYITQNDSDTVGFSFAVTAQSNPTQFFSRELKTAPGQTELQGDGTYVARDNPRTGVVSRNFKRTSFAGALQFEPNDQFDASVDLFYSDAEDEGIFRGIETPIASWSGTNVTSFGANPGGFASTATYDPVAAILRTDTEGNEVEIFAGGVNANYQFTDRLRLTGDVSHSKLDRTDIDYESYAGTGSGILFGANSANPALRSSLTYVTPDEGDYSIQTDGTIDYTDPGTISLTDPGGWGQVGFVREPVVEDELTQLRAEAGYDLDSSFISEVSGGVIFTDRSKSFDDNPRFLRAGAGFVDSTQAIPAGTIVGATDTGSIGFPIIAYDPERFLSDGTYRQEATNGTVFTIDEDITTLYAIAEIDSMLGTVPVRGNFGVQYVDTEQASTGTLVSGPGERRTQTIEDDYSFWLPSANLSFEVANDTFLRAAFAKTATRPRLDDLAANQSLNFNNTICLDSDGDQLPDTLIAPVSPPNNLCYSLGGGNPFLRPYRTTQFDAAVEKYFGASSAISLAGFYKDLKDYVQGTTIFIDGSDFIRRSGNGAFLDANPSVATTGLGGPDNIGDGSIKGIEATIRVNFADFIDAPFLDGFGVNASYGYTDAEIDVFNDSSEIPGFSQDTASAELYYEKFGFRARINGRYRSGYLSEIQQFDGSLIGQRALDEFILDAQVGYEWDSGPLEGLSVNFEAYNLTDEPFRTENDLDGGGPGTETFVSRHEQYGTTYNFTIAKKF